MPSRSQIRDTELAVKIMYLLIVLGAEAILEPSDFNLVLPYRSPVPVKHIPNTRGPGKLCDNSPVGKLLSRR